MELQTLTTFLMWCTILNGGLLLLWSVKIIWFQDFIFRVHQRWFPMSREAFTLAMYGFLGLFKILFLFFNLFPYLALLIMG